jgi:hypothetical protein
MLASLAPADLAVVAGGGGAFAHACKLRLEGSLEAQGLPYRSGRSPHWIKSKYPKGFPVARWLGHTAERSGIREYSPLLAGRSLRTKGIRIGYRPKTENSSDWFSGVLPYDECMLSALAAVRLKRSNVVGCSTND